MTQKFHWRWPKKPKCHFSKFPKFWKLKIFLKNRKFQNALKSIIILRFCSDEYIIEMRRSSVDFWQNKVFAKFSTPQKIIQNQQFVPKKIADVPDVPYAPQKTKLQHHTFSTSHLLFVSLSGEVNFSKVGRNGLEIVIFDLSYSFLEPRKVSGCFFRKKKFGVFERFACAIFPYVSLRAIWSWYGIFCAWWVQKSCKISMLYTCADAKCQFFGNSKIRR